MSIVIGLGLFGLFIWGVIAGGVARDHSAQALDQNAAQHDADDAWLRACARRAVSSFHDEGE